MTSAVNTHEKNYARVMAMLHRELSFRGTPKSNRAKKNMKQEKD